LAFIYSNGFVEVEIKRKGLYSKTLNKDCYHGIMHSFNNFVFSKIASSIGVDIWEGSMNLPATEVRCGDYSPLMEPTFPPYLAIL